MWIENSPDLPHIQATLGRYPDIHPASSSELLGTPDREKACRAWLDQEDLYQLPTLELVDWIRERIGGRTGLEICAGHGWLGEALGIHSTDGWVFDHPAIQKRMEVVGHQYCKPLPRVERIDAEMAVQKYKPQVVVACYATHKWCPKTRTGSALGVDDQVLFNVRSVETYILVGAKSVHAHRPFFKKPHETHTFPWLFSRGQEPRIWVWNK